MAKARMPLLSGFFSKGFSIAEVRDLGKQSYKKGGLKGVTHEIIR